MFTNTSSGQKHFINFFWFVIEYFRHPAQPPSPQLQQQLQSLQYALLTGTAKYLAKPVRMEYVCPRYVQLLGTAKYLVKSVKKEYVCPQYAQLMGTAKYLAKPVKKEYVCPQFAQLTGTAKYLAKPVKKEYVCPIVPPESA